MSVTSIMKDGYTVAQVRAGFVAQGSSLHGWCSKNGIDSNNARKALTGKWTGPKAAALVQQLVRASQGEDA